MPIEPPEYEQHCDAHARYDFSCTDCKFARMAHENINCQQYYFAHKGNPWPQSTLIQSEQEASYSRGHSNLIAVQTQINALHLTVAGTCSDLLTSFHPNTGAEIMAEYQHVFVSIANLQLAMKDLATHVQSAINDLNAV